MTHVDIELQNELIQQLQRHEGCIKDKTGLHIAYKCPAGKLTIGYGHNLDACPIKNINKDSRLSEAHANAILLNDMAVVYEQIATKIPWVRDLDSVRAAVLVNMAFNMGINGLTKFKKTLRLVQNGNYAEAEKEMLNSKWAGEVGKRATELAQQMRTGQYVYMHA